MICHISPRQGRLGVTTSVQHGINSSHLEAASEQTLQDHREWLAEPLGMKESIWIERPGNEPSQWQTV
ncbi:MAG: hypothetical protein CM15mP49_13600 [Actinomycetota bacterium]|nr:MAG: hypothetical protein CM15mP49_13600 [Actinomycetota bacterium]